MTKTKVIATLNSTAYDLYLLVIMATHKDYSKVNTMKIGRGQFLKVSVQQKISMLSINKETATVIVTGTVSKVLLNHSLLNPK